MPIDRRLLLSSAAVVAASAGAAAQSRPKALPVAVANDTGLSPDSDHDQTDAVQRLIDEAAKRRKPLVLPPGEFRTRTLTLRPGLHLAGSAGATTIRNFGGGVAMTGDAANDIRLEGLVLDGGLMPIDRGGAGILTLRDSRGLALEAMTLRNGIRHGIALSGCSGSIMLCRVTAVAEAGIFSTDAAGLEIAHNTVTDCGNNGILVWRSIQGEDGTIVTGNRIERIRAASGGSGQNGNGVNVYRAGNVMVAANRITDCAFTAVRGNAASNIQIIGNNCQRLGEVALYAEFGFEGALIASNIVDRAATGISVTNFNEGGRLAVIQGNLIRNLFRREDEPVDKRGDGIAVEADASVTGNTIEAAPGCGILIGWGRYMRDVVATGNLVRGARVGIGVTGDTAAGAVMISGNMISGARDGGIRALKHAEPYGPDLALSRTDSGRVLIERNLVS